MLTIYLRGLERHKSIPVKRAELSVFSLGHLTGWPSRVKWGSWEGEVLVLSFTLSKLYVHYRCKWHL